MKRKWNVSEFEVLDAQTHHFTSTSVRGGGGQVSNTDGIVQGHINPISSTTDFHRNQEIWVRDLINGGESRLEFGDMEVAVRPGHKVIALSDPETNKFVRVYNVNTRMIYMPGDWNDRKLPGSFAIWFMTVIVSIGLFLPFINFLVGPMFLAEMFGLMKDSVMKYVSLKAKWILIGLGCYDFSALYLAIGLDGRHGPAFLTAMIGISAIPLFGWYYRKQMIKVTEESRSVSNELDTYVTEYTSRAAV